MFSLALQQHMGQRVHDAYEYGAGVEREPYVASPPTSATFASHEPSRIHPQHTHAHTHTNSHTHAPAHPHPHTLTHATAFVEAYPHPYGHESMAQGEPHATTAAAAVYPSAAHGIAVGHDAGTPGSGSHTHTHTQWFHPAHTHTHAHAYMHAHADADGARHHGFMGDDAREVRRSVQYVVPQPPGGRSPSSGSYSHRHAPLRPPPLNESTSTYAHGHAHAHAAPRDRFSQARSDSSARGRAPNSSSMGASSRTQHRTPATRRNAEHDATVSSVSSQAVMTAHPALATTFTRPDAPQQRSYSALATRQRTPPRASPMPRRSAVGYAQATGRPAAVQAPPPSRGPPVDSVGVRPHAGDFSAKPQPSPRPSSASPPPRQPAPPPPAKTPERVINAVVPPYRTPTRVTPSHDGKARTGGRTSRGDTYSNTIRAVAAAGPRTAFSQAAFQALLEPGHCSTPVRSVSTPAKLPRSPWSSTVQASSMMPPPHAASQGGQSRPSAMELVRALARTPPPDVAVEAARQWRLATSAAIPVRPIASNRVRARSLPSPKIPAPKTVPKPSVAVGSPSPTKRGTASARQRASSSHSPTAPRIASPTLGSPSLGKRTPARSPAPLRAASPSGKITTPLRSSSAGRLHAVSPGLRPASPRVASPQPGLHDAGSSNVIRSEPMHATANISFTGQQAGPAVPATAAMLSTVLQAAQVQSLSWQQTLQSLQGLLQQQLPRDVTGGSRLHGDAADATIQQSAFQTARPGLHVLAPAGEPPGSPASPRMLSDHLAGELSPSRTIARIIASSPVHAANMALSSSVHEEVDSGSERAHATPRGSRSPSRAPSPNAHQALPGAVQILAAALQHLGNAPTEAVSKAVAQPASRSRAVQASASATLRSSTALRQTQTLQRVSRAGTSTTAAATKQTKIWRPSGPAKRRSSIYLSAVDPPPAPATLLKPAATPAKRSVQDVRAAKSPSRSSSHIVQIEQPVSDSADEVSEAAFDLGSPLGDFSAYINPPAAAVRKGPFTREPAYGFKAKPPAPSHDLSMYGTLRDRGSSAHGSTGSRSVSRRSSMASSRSGTIRQAPAASARVGRPAPKSPPVVPPQRGARAAASPSRQMHADDDALLSPTARFVSKLLSRLRSQ